MTVQSTSTGSSTARQDSTCYLERSKVRELLIEQPDESLHITEQILAEVDALPIVTAEDILVAAQGSLDRGALSREQIAKAIYASWLSADFCTDNHFQWFDGGKDNPDSCVHYSNVAKAYKAADAILTATPQPASNAYSAGKCGAWQPIEAAPPKSDKPMLLYFPPKVVGAYKQSTQPAMYRTGHPSDFPNRAPTHFMLLDAPSVSSTHQSAPGFSAPQNNAERLPSSNAAEAGADTMRNAVIEECAKVCEDLRHEDYSAETSEWSGGTFDCARAIRALSLPSTESGSAA